MNNLVLPYVNIPNEFLELLKLNQSNQSIIATLNGFIVENKALNLILEKALGEFDEKKSIERIFNALGWSNFRERFASIYVHKRMYGNFPLKTNIDLVDDIRSVETKFHDHSVNSLSRLFLLGFYLKMANIEIENAESTQLEIIKIPEGVLRALKMSEGRSEKIDWLILTTLHFCHFLGEDNLVNNIKSRKKFDDIYIQLNHSQRDRLHQNLLAYGASIQEADNFLYEKI